jgi:site-specific recombinase XerD
MDIIDIFRTHLQESAKDPKTINSYIHVVKELNQWLNNDTDALIMVKPIDIRNYITYLRHNRRLAPSTVNKYIASLKSFYHFLSEQGVISNNPMEQIKRVSFSNVSITNNKWLSPIEQEKFLNYATLEKNEWIRTRNLAVIDLMLFAGLRVQEVSDLKIQDVTPNKKNLNILVIDGKHGKYAEVTLVAKYARNLKNWLRLRKESKKPCHVNSTSLFVSERSSSLTTRAIQKFVLTDKI